MHQVNIEELTVNTKDEEVILPTPKLPSKPEKTIISNQTNLLSPLHESNHVMGVDNLDLNVVKIVNLPLLKDPKLTIEPIYKVMPIYSTKALKDNQSGDIRLRYNIDKLGNVNNIYIVSSTVGRELQRSAKKALAKWRYNPIDNVQRDYEIIFEFKGVN